MALNTPPARETLDLQAPLDPGLIRRMYAPNCTADEFRVFLAMADRYGLDPSLQQIRCIKYPGGDPAKILISRDGLLDVAHRDPNFDGMESGSRGSVKDGDLIGWCRVFRKDMSHPFSVEVYYDEYVQRRRDGQITRFWAQKPRTMIQKVAEAHALRRAFRIQGVYCEDEMPEPPAGPKEIPDTSAPVARETEENPADLPPARGKSSTGIFCEVCGRDADPAKQREILQHTRKHMCDACYEAWLQENEGHL